MRKSWLIGIGGLVGLGFLMVSATASAALISCVGATHTVTVDGASACAGPIAGNIPPYDINDPADSPDMGLGFSDWTSIEKDNIGEGGEDNGLLQIMIDTASSGQWKYTGTEGYGQLLLVVKFGTQFATFLVDGAIDTWYDWSIEPPQAGGLSHMELFGRGSPTQVPEPATLALLGMGLLGFGVSRKRRA